MPKHKLLFEEEYNFELIGLCSSNSDYRLCWSINKCLDIRLSKESEFSVLQKNNGEHMHSFYSYYDENEHIEYYLIKNLSNNYQRLIPEKDQIDYFIIIKNNLILDIMDLVQKLKENDSILTAFIFDPKDLKSKDNLVF